MLHNKSSKKKKCDGAIPRKSEGIPVTSPSLNQNWIYDNVTQIFNMTPKL